MGVNQMLRELGYLTSAKGVREFQRDYNRLGTTPVLVTGKLDADTIDAIELAHSTREIFSMLRREDKGG